MSVRYLEIFCREAEEHLASLQTGLLTLEKQPANTGLLHELLRNAHTLKGSARMVGLTDISAITHLMEERLKGMERGTGAVDGAAIDLLLKGTDAVALITAALVKGVPPPLDVERFVTEYRDGELSRPLASEPQNAPDQRLGETVRADVRTLDGLVTLIGEMIINRKRLDDKLQRLRGIASAAEPETAAALACFGNDLEEDAIYLGYLVQELHEKAMALRMLPMKSITDGLDRLVRDLAQKLGKEVELEITGTAIEMDRMLLEALKPMLIHLLTNAVCHGIETPQQRLEAGKGAKGKVTLSARHEGSSVLVQVRDDGGGMDPARIRESALRRGLIDEREAAALRDEEALYLTLRPGFSTADEVTDVAGRGVGMDVVRKNVERVKGNLTLGSAKGRGTEVTLQMPLTLSVLEALLVQSAGETFAIPMTYVQEILKIEETEISTLGGREVVKVRGATTPLYSLARLLGLPQSAAPTSRRIAAVVLRLCDQRIACSVDLHLGNSEVVVKGLGKQFRNVRFLFGATIMGNGDPALILNVADLFAEGAAALQPPLRRSAPEREALGSILVVDDSITTRTMEQSILSAHGYRVQTAISGEDALEKAGGERFDLVISDVEMPGIDGFELTRRLRSSERYRDTPIIVVSSLARDEDKRQALDSGAQAYIVKGTFDQNLLLETVQTLIG